MSFADAWTFLANSDYAVFFHKKAGSVLELSSGSNGWFRFISNPGCKSQICWSSTNLSHQDLSAKDLIKRLQGDRGDPLNFDLKIGNWKARRTESLLLAISNSEEKSSEIVFTNSGFVYFYRDERALVLHDGTTSNDDAKNVTKRIFKSWDGGTKETSSSDHEQHSEQCMICPQCYFCTGYGRRCIHCRSNDRSGDAGKVCGCGGGQSGCRKCGMCSACCTSIPKCKKVCYDITLQLCIFLLDSIDCLQSDHDMERVSGSVLCIVCGMRGPSSQTGSHFCKLCRTCATCCGHQKRCIGVPFMLSEGRLYCGRKGLYSCKTCDGQCGPRNGCQCPDCFTTSQRLGHPPYTHQIKVRSTQANPFQKIQIKIATLM